MGYAENNARMADFRREIGEIRKKMLALQAEIEPQPVADYALESLTGTVLLSELFRGRRELFLIHNMGIGCPYCTVWADGYNGVYHHLASRAALVVVGPDAPEAQQRFARGRGWRFPFVSHRNSSLAADLGYRAPGGQLLPGMSVLRKTDAGLVRIGDTPVEPGCDLSPVCRFFDFLGGTEGWIPQFEYDEPREREQASRPGCCD